MSCSWFVATTSFIVGFEAIYLCIAVLNIVVAYYYYYSVLASSVSTFLSGLNPMTNCL